MLKYALSHEGVWGMEVQSHVFMTSVAVAGEWSASRSGHFTPAERSAGTNWTESWVGPNTGLHGVE
jgi:hypothetical protein